MTDHNRYQQLQPEDRMTIASMRQLGCSTRAMARVLQRSASTISRELARNTTAGLGYGSHVAQQACQARKRAARPAAKLHADDLRWSLVLTLLDWKWSPQQIAGTLKRAFPGQPERYVSHETIYTAIYAQPRGELCAASSLPVCVRAAARGCREPGAMTAGARFPRWSASICARLRSKTE